MSAQKATLTTLLAEEITGHFGATHVIELPAAALTQTAANTSQVFAWPIPSGTLIKGVYNELHEAFADPTDAAFNSVTVTVGDATTAASIATAQQVAANNAAPLKRHWGTTTYGNYSTAAGGELRVTVASMAAKALASLTKGRLFIYIFAKGLNA
jgi:hypothetical protein